MAHRSAKQIIYYYFFVLIIMVMVGGLLFYNIQTRSQDFADNQQRLMQSSVVSASNEITLLIKELRRMVGLFANQHQDLLQTVADDPDDIDAFDNLSALVKQYFPNYFAVTLANSSADLLLDDFEGFVGPVCQKDIKGFVAEPHKPHVFVHPNNEGYHFDIMSTWGGGKVLFISFKLEDITRLLKSSELPDHQLFLVKQDVPDLIEISDEGGRVSLSRDIKLSEAELARIGYKKPVADTLWDLVDIPAEGLFANNQRQIQYENLIILAIFFIMLLLMLVLLLREYKKSQEAQAQLVQSSKMASLGQMVAGVAHEVNTPLGYVQSNVEMVGGQLEELKALSEQCGELQKLLKQKSSKPGELKQHMESFFETIQTLHEDDVLSDALSLTEDSQHGLERISELVQSLKDFSRMDRQHLDGFSLNDGLDSTLSIGHNVIKDKVEIVKQYAEDLPEVRCAPSQINQVLLNLITNAAQAMEASGTITLETGTNEHYVYAKVRDDGQGIAKKDLEHIFDPFFTTKAVGEGTGLGLSISYKIIEDHGGKLEVKSTVGKGTEFTVSLPLEEA